MSFSSQGLCKKRLLLRWLLLIFGIVVSACNPPSNSSPEVVADEKPVQVLVWDFERQVPLPRAEVTLNIPNQIFPVEITDNSGRAVFHVREGLLSETATFVVQKNGYQSESQVVTLANARILTVYLVPEGVNPVLTNTPTATMTAISTVTANSFQAVTEVPTLTITAIPSNTPVPTFTTTPTQIPTQIPTQTPSNTPVSLEVDLIATALLSSSIFEEPDSSSDERTFVDSGERVVVLQQQGSWIYVRDSEGIEGWAAANRFDITLGTPTPVPVITASVEESSSIFTAPNEESDEITFVNPGVEVRVLGRSENNTWLFIRTEENVEGWVAANRLILQIEIDSLPEVDVTVTTTTSTSGGSASGGLTLDFWNLPGEARCLGSGWTLVLFLEAHGGDAPYTYYINNELVAGSVTSHVTTQFSGVDSTARIYKAQVISSSGQIVTKEILVTPPNCK
ncbi:MAG: SH3 domain-containing protein [Anaerolineaceae bacterium]|nr:SH3 domain-containing protein [Anaerolineaceae bacterium]